MTVGAHPHENLQILSDSYQMVYVLLACFFFVEGSTASVMAA